MALLFFISFVVSWLSTHCTTLYPLLINNSALTTRPPSGERLFQLLNSNVKYATIQEGSSNARERK